MESITIDLVLAADGEEVYTAFDADGRPICSLADNGNGWEIVDGISGERLESLADVEVDGINADSGKIHKALYRAAESI